MSAQNADYGRDDTPLCAPWHKDGKCPWYDHSDGSMHPAACGPRCRSQHTDDHSRCEQYDGSGCGQGPG